MEIYLLQGPLFKQMHLSTYPVLRTDPLGIKTCHEGASTKETCFRYLQGRQTCLPSRHWADNLKCLNPVRQRRRRGRRKTGKQQEADISDVLTGGLCQD